jgi:hypothetical protein
MSYDLHVALRSLDGEPFDVAYVTGILGLGRPTAGGWWRPEHPGGRTYLVDVSADPVDSRYVGAEWAVRGDAWDAAVVDRDVWLNVSRVASPDVFEATGEVFAAFGAFLLDRLRADGRPFEASAGIDGTDRHDRRVAAGPLGRVQPDGPPVELWIGLWEPYRARYWNVTPDPSGPERCDALWAAAGLSAGIPPERVHLGPSLTANRSDDEPLKPYRHHARLPADRAESVLAQLLDALEREPSAVEFVAVQDEVVCAYWREMLC